MENEEIEEQEKNTNAVIENSNDTDIDTNENLATGIDDNIETVVKKRNEEAEKGKEQLLPVPEDEEEEKKSSSFLKYGAVALLSLCALGVYFNRKNTPNPHNLAQNGELNEN